MEANERIHADCVLYGHMWVRAGTVVSSPGKPVIMHWGPPMCLRCHREGPDDLPPKPVVAEACGGCRLKSLVLEEAKRLMHALLVEAANTKASRAASEFLISGERKIRAMLEG